MENKVKLGFQTGDMRESYTSESIRLLKEYIKVYNKEFKIRLS